jgi:hypothetical protein
LDIIIEKLLFLHLNAQVKHLAKLIVAECRIK